MRASTRTTALALFALLPLAACGGGEEASESTDASPSATPEDPLAGWQVRTDPGDTVATEGRFTASGDGFRVRPGPRAIFFHPDSTASGRYRLEATFARLQEPRMPEAYGLLLGGRDLKTPRQDYLYFLIRKDGSYLVKHRAGEETHTVVSWTEHPAVATTSGDTVRNTLAVESDSAEVRFLVNGETVEALSRAPMLRTDGVVGVRINHGLDVAVRNFRTGPLGGGS